MTKYNFNVANITAFVPVLNGGREDIDEYQFSCGARLIKSPNGDFNYDHMQSAFSAEEWISQRELRHFEASRAWLYLVRSAEWKELYEVHRTAYAYANILDQIMWCADLAGCGENDYWRGAGLECCGIYLYSDMSHQIYPARYQFRFKTPVVEDRTASWRKERLAIADSLHQALSAYEGGPIPRLASANNLRRALNTQDAYNWNVRLQLTVTALETFYIAPNEHCFIWEAKIKERITQVHKLQNIAPPNEEFFENLKHLRNDVAHRGGIPSNPLSDRHIVQTLRDAEHLLDTTLCWGILNQNLIVDAFDHDAWPI